PFNSFFRYTIAGTGNAPNVYTAARPSRACNYLQWEDETAYLDWAALRPLTELEYEKVCRGTNPPVGFEGAWGTSYGTKGIAISGTEDGTETITNYGANVSATG